MKLLYIIMSFICASAQASDMVKYNPLGQAPIKHTKLTVDPNRVLILRGVVSDASISPLLSQLSAYVAASSDKVYLIIDSPGGSVGSGLLLVNAMQAAKADKGVKMVCVIQNEAFSMAAIIQSFCYQTYIIAGSGLMYHEAAFRVEGQVTQVKSYVNFVDAQLDELNDKIARQLGMTKDQYTARISREWWLTSEQAASYGLVDGVIEYVYYPEPKQDNSNPFEDLLKRIPAGPSRFIR